MGDANAGSGGVGSSGGLSGWVRYVCDGSGPGITGEGTTVCADEEEDSGW
jgi:hypothetical protein